MIKFLRKYAHIFGWIIVITFVGTMFTGTLFLKGLFKNKNNMPLNNAQSAQSWASIDNTPLDQQYFSNTLNAMLRQIYQATGTTKIDPEFLEYLMTNAFDQTVQHTAFIIGAKEQKLKVSQNELDTELAHILSQYQLKNKKELKKLLKKNNLSYNEFTESIKDDILSRKFANLLTKEVTVTDKDVENSTIRLNAQHILIKIDSTPKTKTEMEAAEKKAMEKILKIKEEIYKGLPFESAAKTYSEDNFTKQKGGNLGWFGIDTMFPSFEKAAFSLEKGEISDPVRTIYGYHLIKIIDKKFDRPQNFNFEQTKQQILENRRNQLLKTFLQNKRNQLKINEPQLLAIQAKRKGDTATAEQFYQGLVGKDPTSPVPHYLLAKLYSRTPSRNTNQILDELKRASIKAELNPNSDFTELHLELGKIYQNQKQIADSIKELDKAWILASGNIPALEAIKIFYQNSKDSKNQTRAEKEIERVKKLFQEDHPITSPNVNKQDG